MYSNSKKSRAVLFDLDGTLVDTAPDFTLAANALRKSLGLTALPESVISPQVSNGSIAVTATALNISPNDTGFERYRIQLLKHYKQQIGAASKVYATLETLLSELDQRKIAWGIITNKPLEYAKPLLQKLALMENCATLVCPDHVKNPKPDPEGLLLAAQTLDLHPNSCIYVGDHERDIEAGNAAHMATIAVGYGYTSSDQQPTRWPANYFAESPQALSAIVTQLLLTTD